MLLLYLGASSIELTSQGAKGFMHPGRNKVKLSLCVDQMALIAVKLKIYILMSC